MNPQEGEPAVKLPLIRPPREPVGREQVTPPERGVRRPAGVRMSTALRSRPCMQATKTPVGWAIGCVGHSVSGIPRRWLSPDSQVA